MHFTTSKQIGPVPNQLFISKVDDILRTHGGTCDKITIRHDLLGSSLAEPTSTTITADRNANMFGGFRDKYGLAIVCISLQVKPGTFY